MNAIWKDFKYALRMLRKGPWLSLAVVVELALSLGANVVIFSVVNNFYLKPLPFPDADRLVQILQVTPEETGSTWGGARFHFWEDHGQGIFGALAAYDAQGFNFKVRTPDGTEVIGGSRVTGDFFQVFRNPLARGRVFEARDDEPGAPLVAIVSHRLWQRKFGSDPDLVGRSITIDGETAEIVGIMSPGFRHPSRSELWTPLRMEPDNPASILRVAGRLPEGAERAEAVARLDAIDRQFRGLRSDEESPEKLAGVPLRDFLYGNLRPALLILLAAVGLVLLIACANVANLQLARSAARQRELAIRVAVGAKPIQVARLLLIESLTLALIGGLLSFGICYLTLGALLGLAPPDVRPQLVGVQLDLTVFGFALALSLLTGLIVGALPAFSAGRADVQGVIKKESTGSGAGSGWRVRYGMVAFEIALALVLMISAGLLVKSFAGLRDTPLGFRVDHLLTLKAHLTDRYAAPAALGRMQREVLPKIEALPGAQRAALVTSLPLELGADMPFVIQDGAGPDIEGGIVQYRGVSTGYFETLEVPLVRGRAFAAGDRDETPLVAVINEAAAERYFPDGALGRRIIIGLPDMPDQADPSPREIVGIVRDVREAGHENEATATLYVPVAQIPESLNSLLIELLPLNLIVRTQVAPGTLSRSVQQVMWTYDPDLPVSGVATMNAIVSRSIGPQNFQMVLIGALAALALVLSVLGTYAVLTYLVSQRTRELGVRMALGSDPFSIVVYVVRQGMTVVLVGIVMGIFGAWISTRVFASFLYGVSATDFTTFLSVALLMGFVAFLATLLPARRGARISPMEALRCP